MHDTKPRIHTRVALSHRRHFLPVVQTFLLRFSHYVTDLHNAFLVASLAVLNGGEQLPYMASDVFDQLTGQLKHSLPFRRGRSATRQTTTELFRQKLKNGSAALNMRTYCALNIKAGKAILEENSSYNKYESMNKQPRNLNVPLENLNLLGRSYVPLDEGLIYQANE